MTNLEWQIDYKRLQKEEERIGIFIYQIFSLSSKILFYFLKEVIFLNNACVVEVWLTPIVSSRGWKFGDATKLWSARFFWRNKCFKSNINIFHYI